jgi:hypothetical protein
MKSSLRISPGCTDFFFFLIALSDLRPLVPTSQTAP